MPEILGFLMDDRNREKFAAHGLREWEVDQLLDDEFLVVPNRHGRSAPLLLIGRDHGGRCLVVPIDETAEEGVWRPITAWPCKDSELARLEAAKGRQR